MCASEHACVRVCSSESWLARVKENAEIVCNSSKGMTVLKAQWKTEINPQKPLSTPHSTHYSQNILGEGVDLILN